MCGRGTLDDKSNLFAAMMTMVLLKRTNARLDRDVILVSEAGEEGNSRVGIGYLVEDHFRRSKPKLVSRRVAA